MADSGESADCGVAVPSVSPASSSPPVLSNSPLDPSSFIHTPYYCEENVYLLCKKLSEGGIAAGADVFIVFISNEEKKVPMWHQKAGEVPDGFVVWDYHVICVQSRRSKAEALDLVWDLDSNLPFPCPLVQYICDAIRPLSFDDSSYRRLFRVIHGPIFLRSFASDRSHMKDPSGNWVELPPTYEPIASEDGTSNNLDEYITMSIGDVASLESMVDVVYSNKYGVVVDENLLQEFFSRLHG